VTSDDLITMVSGLKGHVERGSEEEYFLTRLTYPHLQPGDMAELLITEAGGARQADVVVTLEDNQGRPFFIRHPINPREVATLHKLFLAAKLEVTFRPEHHYLVAVGPRGDLLGGIFFEVMHEEERAHLEKIVVSERVRRQGISDALMYELFKRLRADGIRTVTTGFFKPGYFYQFGFAIERGYAGLAKDLTAERSPEEQARSGASRTAPNTQPVPGDQP
jgi:GNAT superfamily N-acetyltransferase